jgi:hypothetical protein
MYLILVVSQFVDLKININLYKDKTRSILNQISLFLLDLLNYEAKKKKNVIFLR